MKPLLLLFAIFTLVSCSSDSDSKESNSEFKGVYNGTFSRITDDGSPATTGNGTIAITIDKNGQAHAGYDVTNLGYFLVYGQVDSNGNLHLEPTGTDTGNAATFDGVISNELIISGTWTDESRDWNGVFTAD